MLPRSSGNSGGPVIMGDKVGDLPLILILILILLLLLLLHFLIFNEFCD